MTLVLQTTSVDLVLQTAGTTVVLSAPSGIGGGEANILADAGSGAHESLVASPSKAGVSLQIAGLRAGAGISLATNTGDNVVEVSQAPGFAGDMFGPNSSVEDSVPVYDGTTGKIIKDPNAIKVSSGQVGIGVSPAHKLDLEETSAGPADAARFTRNHGGVVGNVLLKNIAGSAGSGMSLAVQTNASGIQGRIGYVRTNTPLAGQGDIFLEVGGVERWRVLSTGEIAAQGGDRQIKNVANPTLAQDAATKDYVDNTVAVPAAHGATHENGGADEISVAGLSGLLADDQNPTAHAIEHSDGGVDEITVQDLGSGAATSGHLLTADGAGGLSFASPGAPSAHASTHENGGADEISVAGLSGLLADDQNPTAHASDHQHGGSDEVATATPGANEIPKADGSGLLDSWISSASETVAGRVELATQAEVDTGTDTVRAVTPATLAGTTVTPETHATSHENGGADEISVAGLSGLLADDQNPTAHASDHENGGSDEIDVGGLSGLLADAQNPTAHASSHSDGGSDEITASDLGSGAATSGDVLAADGAGGNSYVTPLGLTSSAPVDVDKSAAVVGIGLDAARADHKHDISTASAVTETADSTNTEGVATSLARSDHTHDIDTATGTISTIDAGDAAQEGTAAGISRRDHQHGVSTGTPGAITPDDAAAEGAATSLARSDHTHGIAAAAPSQGIGGGNSEGTGSDFARADHDHTLRETGGATDLTVGAIADGQTLQRSGTALIGVTPVATDELVKVSVNDTTAGYLLGKITAGPGIGLVEVGDGGDEDLRVDGVALTASAPANVSKAAAVVGVATDSARADHKHDIDTAAPGASVDAGDTSVEGTATTLARSDHQHAVSTGAASGLDSASTNTEGAATDLARSDHTHEISETGTVSTIEPDDTAADGVAAGFARKDHGHAIVAATAGSIAIGDTAAEGAATSFARSDHTHGLASPPAPADVTKAAASAGVATTVARSDHKHDVTTAAPGAAGVGTTSAEGVATTLARSDHTHQSNTTPADVTKAVAAIGTSTEPARADHKHDVTTAVAGTIEPDDAAAEGAATSLARSDHQHAISAAVTMAIGGGNSEGTATSFARSDHNHKLVETGGPTEMTIASVADGQFLQRSGATLIGATPSAGSITNSQATATADDPITSATYTLVNSMTLTPGVGDYYVSFNSSGNLSANNSQGDFALYVNGVQVAHTVRSIGRGGGATSGTELGVSISAVVTGVLAAQAIEIRGQVTAGTMNVHERTLTLLKVA